MVIEALFDRVKRGRLLVLRYLRQEINHCRIIGTHCIDLRLLLTSRKLSRRTET